MFNEKIMMKITKYLFGLGLLAFTSCEKDLIVKNAPDLDVSTEKTEYNVGEQITFKYTGYADVISFYSGAIKNDYAFKDGRIVDLPTKGLTLSFQSAVSGGTQANQLAILASSDFNGNYSNLASVKAATWTDITSRFTYGTNATFVASTSKDLSDLAVAGKPLYIAFKYVTKPQLVNGVARSWMIQSFEARSTSQFNGANPVIKDQIYASFVVTGTRLTLLGNTFNNPADPIFDPTNPIFDPNNPIYNPKDPLYIPTAVRPTYVPYDPNNPYNDALRETWAVSTPIVLDKLDAGPDVATTLRGVRNTKLTESYHTYTAPGNYKLYFIGSNVTVDDKKTVVRELNLKINPAPSTP
jgi:hypothetical protein